MKWLITTLVVHTATHAALAGNRTGLIGQERRLELLEVFGGVGETTYQATRDGLRCAAPPVYIKYGWDLYRPEERPTLLDKIDTARPRLVMV